LNYGPLGIVLELAAAAVSQYDSALQLVERGGEISGCVAKFY
jgi:hypothetical protein